MEKNSKRIEELNGISIFLIILSIVFVIASFILPYTLTQFSFIDFTSTGQIGDTIGGIMNPFISIASFLMMFLVFYMQYNANKLQRQLVNEQMQNEKFENQFFEMLKIHKENSNTIISAFHEDILNNGFGGGVIVPQQYYKQRMENRKKGFEYLVNKLEKEYDKRKNGQENKELFTKIYSEQWEDSFGHYFRHLFLLVKFIVQKEFLTYEEKRSCLRILRASLSAYEQIFLYYNWLSDYGTQWENEENKFFSDYRMIHNISPNLLIDDFDVRLIEPFKTLIKNKSYKKEENRCNDSLFEFEDWD